MIFFSHFCSFSPVLENPFHQNLDMGCQKELPQRLFTATCIPYLFIYTRMPEFTRTPHKAVAKLEIFCILQPVNSAKCGTNIEISKLCNA